MPDTATPRGEATGTSDPSNPTGEGFRVRRIVSYLWLPTPWEQRGYDWMEDHHVAVNVCLGLAFPPYGIFLLILWGCKGYDKDRPSP